MAKAEINKTKERGTGDELEIMREIIKKDPYLMEKVLNKIREIRDAGSKGFLDTVAEKQNNSREDKRKRGAKD